MKDFIGRLLVKLEINPAIFNRKHLSNLFTVECVRNGVIVWTEEFCNMVVNEGLNDSLDKHLKGAAYTAGWFVGLTDASPITAPDNNMVLHPGWSEADEYDEATRQLLVLGSVANGSVDNSASKASFTINADILIGGAFIVNDNVKNGTAGILYGVGPFTGSNRDCQIGDTLNVTVTASAQAS